MAESYEYYSEFVPKLARPHLNPSIIVPSGLYANFAIVSLDANLLYHFLRKVRT